MKLNSLRKLVGGLGSLHILFKEVLQQTPPDLADELARAYREGKSLMLVMGHSAKDKFPNQNKTAFRWVFVENDVWRDPSWRPAHTLEVTPLAPLSDSRPN